MKDKLNVKATKGFTLLFIIGMIIGTVFGFEIIGLVVSICVLILLGILIDKLGFHEYFGVK